MKLILASSNKGKAKELSSLLGEWATIDTAQVKIEVIEDGKTFNENALKKAKAYFDKYGVPVVSDDSGLVVPAFPDILGIYSARFAPEVSDYESKCGKLLELLESEDESKREAYFVCYLCFYLSPEEIYFFEGRLNGKIGKELKGDGGFGYDPVFIPDGMDESLAQLSDWKEKNSHRARACTHARTFFLQRNLQTV